MTIRSHWAVRHFVLLLCVLLIASLPACSQSSPSASAALEVKVPVGDGEFLQGQKLAPEVKNRIAHFLSEEVRHDVLESPEVQATTWYQAFDGDKAAAHTALGDMLAAESEQGTGLIHLTLHAEDGEEAKTILTQWIIVFLREVESMNPNTAEHVKEAYQVDLDSAVEEAAGLTERLYSIEYRSPRTTTDGRLSDKVRQLHLLTNMHTQAEDELAASQAFYDLMILRSEGHVLKPTDDEIPIIEQSPEVSELRARIRRLQITGGAEDVILGLQQALEEEFGRQFQAILAAKIEEARLAVSTLQDRVEVLDQQRLEVQTQFDDINRIQSELDVLRRQLQEAETRVERTRNRLDDMEILTPRIVIVTQHIPPAINQP